MSCCWDATPIRTAARITWREPDRGSERRVQIRVRPAAVGRVRGPLPARRCSVGGRIPVDVQLCELANPAKWDNPDWLAILRSLASAPTRKRDAPQGVRVHADASSAAAARPAHRADVDLQRRRRTRADPLLAGQSRRQGRRHGPVRGEWEASAREGDAGVLHDPSTFAPFPYRREQLSFLRMDGSRLAFAAGGFDVVVFAVVDRTLRRRRRRARSVEEMARVLKPGGVLALATEWCVPGAAGGEIFSPAEVRRIIDHPALGSSSRSTIASGIATRRRRSTCASIATSRRTCC